MLGPETLTQASTWLGKARGGVTPSATATVPAGFRTRTLLRTATSLRLLGRGGTSYTYRLHRDSDNDNNNNNPRLLSFKPTFFVAAKVYGPKRSDSRSPLPPYFYFSNISRVQPVTTASTGNKLLQAHHTRTYLDEFLFHFV